MSDKRLTEQRLTGPGAHQINYGYDKRGSLVSRTTSVDGKNYVWEAEYTATGQIARETYHSTPCATTTNWTPYVTYDTADRIKSFGSYMTSVTYDIWNNRETAIFQNNVQLDTDYDAQRGWVTRNKYINGTGRGNIVVATYTMSTSGRVMRVNHTFGHGDLDFTYDFRGRLLSATYFGTNISIGPQADQTFQYDGAGRMRFNSLVGTYNYPTATSVGGNGNSPHSHAPNSVSMAGGGQDTFTFDENGNMTQVLSGKVMAYDGENRPLSVVFNSKTTSCVASVNGTRLKKIENAGSGSPEVTAYINGTEIRNYVQGTSEVMVNHLTDKVRLTREGSTTKEHFLHHDQLGSVIGISKFDGMHAQRRSYHSFGDISKEVTNDPDLEEETIGFICECYDEDAELQYLNAWYYDPKLALFVQSDWFQVTETGVGTNRFSYAFNDPVNPLDPSGNSLCGCGLDVAIAGAVALGIAAAEVASDLANDGQINGNGLLSGSTAAAIDFAAEAISSISRTEETPFGVEIHGGRLGIDLPNREDFAGAREQEIRDYIDVSLESERRREKHLKENVHGLTPKQQKPYRTKLANKKSQKKG